MTGVISDQDAVELALQFRADLKIATIAHEIEDLDFMERQTLWSLLQKRFPISIEPEPWQSSEDQEETEAV